MNGAPPISVIIPLYNKGAYVVRAVRSALLQQPAAAEVLVIDDGSTDSGPALLRQFAEHPRLRVVRQQNAGEGAARNRGLAEMRGDLAAFLDADDEWAPGHLRNLLEAARCCPGAGLLATGYRTLYGRRAIIETAIDADRPVQLFDYFSTARAGFCLHISSCAVWKHAAEEAGGFAEREPVGADLDFFARIALRRPVALHPEISGIYYAAQPGSALHAHAWTSHWPPVVRMLNDAEACGAILPPSAREYADRILIEHVLTGLCAGKRRQSLALLAEICCSRPTPWKHTEALRFVATAIPPALLRAFVRLRRSRLAVRNLPGRPAITNRVVYSHA